MCVSRAKVGGGTRAAPLPSERKPASQPEKRAQTADNANQAAEKICVNPRNLRTKANNLTPPLNIAALQEHSLLQQAHILAPTQYTLARQAYISAQTVADLTSGSSQFPNKAKLAPMNRKKTPDYKITKHFTKLVNQVGGHWMCVNAALPPEYPLLVLDGITREEFSALPEVQRSLVEARVAVAALEAYGRVARGRLWPDSLLWAQIPRLWGRWQIADGR